jgi:Phosphoenolpyruvate carboxykinase
MEAVGEEFSQDVSIDRFVIPRHNRNARRVVRHSSGQLVLVEESALDLSRLPQTGTGLLQLGRRVRVLNADMRRQLASYILPAELARLPRARAQLLDGCATPLGKVVFDHGLFLALKPGLSEIGVNDRRDVILRYDEEAAEDPTRGPVLNSSNTVIAGRAKRLVTRVQDVEHAQDRAEALAWLKALEVVQGRRTLRSRFSCAGIQYEQRGNVPYLQRTTQLNFFSPRDPEMAKVAAQGRERFKTLGREVPHVEILSLLGLPADEKAYRRLRARLKKRRKDPGTLGLPPTLKQSRFYDPASGAIVSSNFVLFCPLSELGERITVITVNTDYHGEVKSRGVLSPLMAIMSLVDIISAHAGCAVHNSRGTVTTFTGPTGTGKTTACTFWAEKNEKYRRAELRRRYEIDLGRGDGAARLPHRDLDRIMKTVGILCQEDWVEIVPMRDGQWVFWPTERACYARTGGFPGLKFVLVENAPLLENACADLGAAGDPEKLGAVTHDYFPERLFYDPDWGHMFYDRTPRPITANVFLERDASLGFCVKRVEPSEAVEWLLRGRTPAGKYEPLYNAYPDFSGLLMEYGIVGDRLTEAYRAATQGNASALAKGDTRIGAALFEKLDIQVKLWRRHCASVPVFIVNGAPGLEITQDVNWYLSEYPDFLASGQAMSVDEFKTLMHSRYGVTYGPKGQWTHVVR